MSDKIQVESMDKEKIFSSLGHTKRRILIEIYRANVGYKKLSKILEVGLDTIRSHIRTGKYSRSLYQMGLVEKGEKGWQLSQSGLEIIEMLQNDPSYKGFFYEE